MGIIDRLKKDPLIKITRVEAITGTGDDGSTLYSGTAHLRIIRGHRLGYNDCCDGLVRVATCLTDAAGGQCGDTKLQFSTAPREPADARIFHGIEHAALSILSLRFNGITFDGEVETTSLGKAVLSFSGKYKRRPKPGDFYGALTMAVAVAQAEITQNRIFEKEFGGKLPRTRKRLSWD